jgi:formate dehydrogenase major subunit
MWQFHTGSMTRRSEDLEREAPTGWVEINPSDAKALGITNGEIVRAVSRRGQVDLPAKVTVDIKPKEVFIPFHFAECAANLLTNNALDPIAKIPELKACAVRIEKIKEA